MKNRFSILILFSLLSFHSFSTFADGKKTLVIVGDSLTEGYGVAKESAYPFLLEQQLGKDHLAWKVINSGIGGSTSASAPGRVKWVLKSKPQIVVLFLGGNDALRGIPPNETQKNLEQAVQLLQEAQVKVILVEMQAPPNYGAEYTKKFKDAFIKVKKDKKIESIAFPLGRVAGRKDLNQADGIHPNEKGHAMIAEDIYKAIKGYL